MNPTNSKEIFAVPRHTAPHSKSRKGSSKSVNESRQNSLLLPVDISKAIDELTISPSVSRLEESHASQNENTEPQVTKTKVTKPQVTEPQKQMMVVSTLNACNINASNGALNQQNLDQAHWRQSPQTTSTENNQQDYIINCNAHDQRPTSPVQNGEDNSCYSSENGADNLSPRQENSRGSGSEDLASNLFPISGSGMMQQCMEYSNSDNESSQASPSSFQEDDYRSGKNSSSSSSKPKIHKCRQCNFSTLSKHESWLHIAIHMKPEKILRCPECPFVTEYKHHLDFHVWNHQGMKPYKCDKCPYVCVNKSMLKSHLKSHSNVYQYRCANCAYRTKYCHSLKIHLRKYRHEPGMVLDSEGNPNPNPIIDVYGNRRGPKQKSRKQDGLQQQKQQQPQQFQQQPQLQQIQPAVPPLNAFPSFPWGVNNAFFTENSHLPCTTLLPNAFINTPFAAAAAAAAITEQAKASVDVTSHDDTINNNLKITNINNNTPSSCNNNNIIFSNNNNENSTNIDSVKPENSSDDEDVFHPDTCLEEPRSVSPSGSSYHQLIDKRPASKIHLPVEEAPLNLSVSSQTLVNAHDTNAITPVVKNRRKGVACKLKRLHTTDDELYAKNLVCSNFKIVQDTVEEKPQSTTDCEIDAQKSTKKNSFYCHFCEITFCNQIMFTMHMGYHGYLDPFTCNRCGKKTEDKIAFYAHMISSAHL